MGPAVSPGCGVRCVVTPSPYRLTYQRTSEQPPEAIAMRLTYYGHASFLVETADKTRVILDPYRAGAFDGAVKHAPIGEPAAVVVASHTHDDHGATDTIPGTPRVFVHPTSETVGGFTITGVPVAHEDAKGDKRGKNSMVVLQEGDARLVHSGDLG